MSVLSIAANYKPNKFGSPKKFNGGCFYKNIWIRIIQLCPELTPILKQVNKSIYNLIRHIFENIHVYFKYFYSDICKIINRCDIYELLKLKKISYPNSEPKILNNKIDLIPILLDNKITTDELFSLGNSLNKYLDVKLLYMLSSDYGLYEWFFMFVDKFTDKIKTICEKENIKLDTFIENIIFEYACSQGNKQIIKGMLKCGATQLGYLINIIESDNVDTFRDLLECNGEKIVLKKKYISNPEKQNDYGYAIPSDAINIHAIFDKISLYGAREIAEYLIYEKKYSHELICQSYKPCENKIRMMQTLIDHNNFHSYPFVVEAINNANSTSVITKINCINFIQKNIEKYSQKWSESEYNEIKKLLEKNSQIIGAPSYIKIVKFIK